jgi:hypothetical protein
METREYTKDGEKRLEVKKGVLDALSYFKVVAIITFSAGLTLVLVQSIVHIAINKADSEIDKLFENMYLVFVEQMGGILLGLVVSYPVYKFLMSRIIKHTFTFKEK